MAWVLCCIHVLEFWNFNICCIKENYIIKLLDIVGYVYCKEYCSMGPRGRFYPCFTQVFGY